MGYTLGTTPKFAMSAFEPAWAPFVYSQARKGGAPETLGRVVTSVFAFFVLATLTAAVLGREVLVVLTPPRFHDAAPVIPVVALAYLLHGTFLLTSIGIGIERKAHYYPIVTAGAAAVNIALNFALVPRWGMMGSAWATVAGYGVMAVLGFVFSHRLYPIPFEWTRLSLVAAAAAVTAALARAAPAGLLSAIAVKVLLLAVFGLVLAALGLMRRPGSAIVEDTHIRGEES